MPNQEVLEDADIIRRFLGWKAKRFVRRVRTEWHLYLNPRTEGQAGFLQRDALRFALEKLAYSRYARTLTP